MGKKYKTTIGIMIDIMAQVSRRHPIFFGVVIFIYVASIPAFFITRYIQSNNVNPQHDLSQQLLQLNQIENSLKDLQEFIKNQKTKLEDAEKTISLLEQEKQKLEPVVKADKGYIENLFRLQEERTRSTVWFERVLSFVFGILSSFAATGIGILFKSARSIKRQMKPRHKFQDFENKKYQ